MSSIPTPSKIEFGMSKFLENDLLNNFMKNSLKWTNNNYSSGQSDAL